jgi:tricorn protease-like protein
LSFSHDNGVSTRLDISDHVTARRIRVYDIEAGKVVSISVEATHHYRYEFDLSADGRRLAILKDDVVRIVDLDHGMKF